ncbi:N-acetylmuramoyl-L-alanine amidase [Paenibacillus sp. FSL M7-1455]|jgi:N-acetylmuramoyl-L-alanine amidase|uniref:Sporulation-specific N-acetylmuramoyl-L-alanine amidase n=1 Tax=Paenibacillus cookii TaxID=157839 RepID=A0ABQ4M1K0_9BACL|nr:N-acetylmuramoyl-L-alanine amidase [Paenibacillus cookii]GIO69401.1 sporulation-specific N-acetylmuramoyl-L-alanine amidase [Paenibacillus cookii]
MKKVWIDAGHGGKDSGATGNGLQEKDVVLALALAIKKRLDSEYEDVQALLSRSTDVFVELKDRTGQANAAGADLLISVHCNAGGGSGGFESYRYTSASAATVKLQNLLHTEIMAGLKPFGVADRGQKTGNLHMCRESRMPAVLTENLFIDVASDAAKLKQPAVMEAIVSGHVLGIAKYLGLKKKETPAPDGPEVTVIANGKTLSGAKLEDGVVTVPLRAIAEALGANLTWDNQTKTATITK